MKADDPDSLNPAVNLEAVGMLRRLGHEYWVLDSLIQDSVEIDKLMLVFGFVVVVDLDIHLEKRIKIQNKNFLYKVLLHYD